jgi:hypothetical protein
MPEKEFIFTPGLWLGEGKISFSSSPEFLKFYTKWEIEEESPGVMKAVQTVEMQGVEEQLINVFIFKDIQPASFSVSLQNNIVGAISGTGLRDAHLIAWEFKGELAFEGFEVYEQQENGDYFLHAEYGSPEQFRTTVEGLIWRKEL